MLACDTALSICGNFVIYSNINDGGFLVYVYRNYERLNTSLSCVWLMGAELFFCEEDVYLDPLALFLVCPFCSSSISYMITTVLSLLINLILFSRSSRAKISIYTVDSRIFLVFFDWSHALYNACSF